MGCGLMLHLLGLHLRLLLRVTTSLNLLLLTEILILLLEELGCGGPVRLLLLL